MSPLRFIGSSIQRKIFFGFVMVATLVLAMVLAEYQQLGQVKQVSEEILPHGQRTGRLQSLGVSLSALESNAERLLVVGDLEMQEKVRQNLDEVRALLATLRQDAPSAATPSARATSRRSRSIRSCVRLGSSCVT